MCQVFFYYLYRLFQKRTGLKNQNFHIDYYSIDSLALTSQDFEGAFDKKCTVLLSTSDQTKENEILLGNILKAIDLDITQDIHLGYLKNDESISLLNYLVNQAPKLVLIFNIAPKALSLHIDPTYYTPVKIGSTTWVFAHALSELSQKKSLKKSLWEALKLIQTYKVMP